MKALKKTTFVSILLLLLILSNGQYAVFFAIWIAIPMLLFAVRKLKRWQGFVFAFLTIAISYYIGFDVVPFIPVALSVVLSLIFSLFASLPYLIDSFFSKKRSSFLSTLIFPCSAVLLEYAYHMINQYGTWGHFAYTQESQHLLLQSVSVFGMGYITFLITWFASVSNWIYEHSNKWSTIKKGVLTYSLVLGLTIIYGGYRVVIQKTNSETVRIASISAQDSLKVMIDIEGLNNKETEGDVKLQTRKNTTKLNQDLFDRAIAEAQAGARIVFWAEGNAVILKEDEDKLYKQASAIASEQNIYLGLGVAVIDHTNSRFLENKFVIFDQAGNKAIDYWKGISVPGAETPISNNKATGIRKVSTPFGTIAGAICFDLDFPGYLEQAKGADILLAPSNDWKEIDPLHTSMAKFRAIEQGFNLIRQTSFGLSAGTDYTGQVISEMDHFADNDKVMTTQLPTKGVLTIYSMIGDTFIVICLVVLILTSAALKRGQTASSKKQSLSLELSRTV